LLPLKDAIVLFRPAGAVATVRDAVPELSKFAVPSDVPPAENTTVPVGVPAAEETFAVKVNVEGKLTVVAELCSVVAVVAAVMVNVPGVFVTA